ncbi:cysteine-rich venom protein 6-like [Anomaloglossus baeobatrachus]|uniref:cysteine-rich venom protein 6-like n=1 Tax=Anomaloglossus baeobatrachus TaxID=238106 RepID=UPI003F50317C
MSPVSALLLSLLGAAFILISAHDVHKNCGPHKEYKECGSACPPNCTHPNGACHTRQCKSGCFCKKGYVELGESCVEKKKCEACTGNTTFRCGTLCPGTCNIKYKCMEGCKEGCFCKEGYVLLDDKSKCVLQKDCPKRTGP